MLLGLKNTKNVSIWLICLAYVGMFFSTRVGNVLMVLLLVYCIVISRPKGIVNALLDYSHSKLLIALFVLQVFGLLYTSNMKTGLFMLEKKISFLIIPLLLFPLFQKIKIDRNLLLNRLGLVTIASSVVLLCIASYRKFVLDEQQAFFFESFREYEGFTPIHYVYYSMYFACGSLIFIVSIFDSVLKRKFGVLILGGVYLYSLSIIVLVASKTGIAVFILCSIVLLWNKISNKKAFAVAIAFVFLSTFAFLASNEITRERFSNLGENLTVLLDDQLVGELQATGLNVRLLFWKITLSNQWKDGLMLTGIGTGDTQDYINALYKLPQYQLYGYIDWDTHNQWVYATLQLGVIGIGMLGLLYLLAGRKAVMNKDLCLVIFLIVTCAFSLTECILEVNKGIVFFALFFTILTASQAADREPLKSEGPD